MQIIVSDASALIDLRKGGILDAFLKLPFELIIPDVLLESELIKFSAQDLAALRGTMTVASLEGQPFQAAIELMHRAPTLTFNDCSAYIVARENPGAILLTGDAALRRIATTGKVEVHGVLWAVELMAEHRTASKRVLLGALSRWQEDRQVRLPNAEIARLITKFERT